MPRAGSVWDESVLRVPKPTSARSAALIRAGSTCAIILASSASSRLGPTTGWLGGGGGWSSSLSAPDAYAPPASSATMATAAVAVVRPLMVPSRRARPNAALDAPADEWSPGKLPEMTGRVKQLTTPSTRCDGRAPGPSGRAHDGCRGSQARADRGTRFAQLLFDDVGGELEVAREVLERKVASAQDGGQPRDFAPEVGEALRVQH